MYPIWITFIFLSILSEYPAPKEEYPVYKEEYPALKEEYPVYKEEYPVYKEEYPVSKEEYPVYKEEYPKEPGFETLVSIFIFFFKIDDQKQTLHS